MRLLVILLILAAEAKRDFVIEIQEFRFNDAKPNYLISFKYNLYQKKYITIEFILNRNISAVELKYKFDMIKRDNKYVNVLNIDIDGCKALASAYNLSLVAAITKEVFRKSNFPKKCPVMANELFYIRNFTFNEEQYPPMTPLMNFQTLTEFYFDRQYQGNLLMRGRIRKK